MPRLVPHHSRAQKGKVHEIWRYTVHYSPVAPMMQFGVSKDGQVVHRARDLTRAMDWALDRTQEFYDKFTGAAHPAVAQARETLEQYGRFVNVAQA